MKQRPVRESYVGRAAVLAGLLALACQPAGDQGPDPSIAVSVSPGTISVTQGSSGSISVQVTRAGGFGGDIAIVVEGAPAGATVVVSDMTTTATTTSAIVAVTIPESVTPGSYPVVVRVTGTGVSEATASAGLTVTARPAISLAAEPAVLSVAVGGSATVGIAISRTNFTGDVALALESTVAGISGTFTAAAGGSSATLNLQIAPTVAVGQQVLTVRATGNGVSSAAAGLAVTITPAPSFSILPLTTDPVPIMQHGATSIAVTLDRTGGFAGPVDLTVDSLPPGVTASFDPATVAGTSSILSLAVGSGAPVGEHRLVIRGTASGQAPKVLAFRLSVAAPPSFSLSVSPPGSVALQPGGSVVNRTIVIDRINFPGAVGLAVTANTGGAGLTANLSSPSTSGSSVSLALSAGAQLVPGTYLVTVTGTAPGLADQSVPVTVEVAAAGTSVTLDYTACFSNYVPVWLAYQDGTGPWRVVTPAGRVFRFTLQAGKGGLAWVWRPSPGVSYHWVNVEYYAAAELGRVVPGQLCPSFPATREITATAILPFGHTATVSLAGATGIAGPVDPVARISISKNGTFDLLGYSVDPAAPGTNDRIFLRRDVNTTPIPGGGSVGFPVDFTDPVQSFAPAAATFTLAGPLAGAGRFTVNGSFRSAGCVWSPLRAVLMPAPPSAFTFLGVPAGLQRSGDLHAVRIEVESASFATYRSVYQMIGALSNRTITLPSELPVFSPTTVGGPYAALRFQFTLPSDLVPSASVSYHDPASFKTVILYASRSWLGGSTVDLAMPRFSGLPGWDDQWVAASGATIDWAVTGGGNRTVIGGFDRDLNPCGVGAVYSTRQGRL